MSGTIPEGMVGTVDQAFAVVSQHVDTVIAGARKLLSEGRDPEELFYGFNKTVLDHLVLAAPDVRELPAEALHEIELISQPLAAAYIRLAQLPVEPAAPDPVDNAEMAALATAALDGMVASLRTDRADLGPLTPDHYAHMVETLQQGAEPEWIRALLWALVIAQGRLAQATP
ncbi:hypothetical protein [Mycolicibacterium llatzerense]|uniref:hypothetical protein n=1 Tax=Mycolicibacterium llatzerense TaxID=280871 RepID=UPI0021B5255A|nr:hypothetical protein [Mycolicibacterium llatzerense]MCT7372730.1 hypothetical protein [Mycolicibacterium llatzerense]